MKITHIEATSHRVPAKVPLMHKPIIREIVSVDSMAHILPIKGIPRTGAMLKKDFFVQNNAFRG